MRDSAVLHEKAGNEMITEAELPGTYRVADGARVQFRGRTRGLGSACLRRAAGYRPQVQRLCHLPRAQRARPRAFRHPQRMLLTNWIGKLLEQVAIRAKANREPSLTSLCVHQDGTIGDGYARAESRRRHTRRRHRILRGAAPPAVLPEARSRPARRRKPPSVDKGRSTATRARKAAQEPAHRALCPVHDTEVPASGHCDYCD
jgi:hypothetical protein